MRIGVISDIHGNLLALEAVLADLAGRAPDLIVNLGDLVSGPLWPMETLQCLAARPGPTVRGNHDRWLAERAPEDLGPTNRFVRAALRADQLAWLGELPSHVVPAPGVLAVHGTPASDTEYLLEDAVDDRLARVSPAVLAERLGGAGQELVLCGHSHAQHAAAAPGGCLVLNPGSVGCPRRVDHPNGAAVEASSPHARYAVATRTPLGWRLEMVAVPYDWRRVVAQAVANGRPDWAEAFRQGGREAGGR